MQNRTKQERIHYFAERWLERFSEEKFDYHAFNYFFGEECILLGFNMDCGHAFTRHLKNKQAFNDADELAKVIKDADKVSALTSGLFSQWRYLTHWSYGTEKEYEELFPWFRLVLQRLCELTEKKKE